MKTIIFSALALTLALAWTSRAAADCCEHCGCQCECQKVCRLICETKKVSKVTYGCECEDVCVPGPSDHCVTYDECGCKKHVYTPTCATVRMRKKLVKHEEVKEVPSYRWVVENVCPACTRQTPPSMPAPSAPAAPAPPDEGSAANEPPLLPIPEEATGAKSGVVARFIGAEAAHEPALNDALANRIMERACRRVPAKRRTRLCFGPCRVPLPACPAVQNHGCLLRSRPWHPTPLTFACPAFIGGTGVSPVQGGAMAWAARARCQCHPRMSRLTAFRRTRG